VFAIALTEGGVQRNCVVEFDEGRRIAWLPAEAGQRPPGAPAAAGAQVGGSAGNQCAWPGFGLRLTERYAGWDRRPFTSASDGHVSVYQRA